MSRVDDEAKAGGELVDENLLMLTDFKTRKMSQLLAITTPIPDSQGNVSKKTPVYKLPVYSIDLTLEGNDQQEGQLKKTTTTENVKCDLADLMDFIMKLKQFESHCRTLFSSGDGTKSKGSPDGSSRDQPYEVKLPDFEYPIGD